MSNWLLDFVNEQPVREALEIVGGRMLEDDMNREDAILAVLLEIPSYRRALFQRILALQGTGKSVTEITHILMEEGENY